MQISKCISYTYCSSTYLYGEGSTHSTILGTSVQNLVHTYTQESKLCGQTNSQSFPSKNCVVHFLLVQLWEVVFGAEKCWFSVPSLEFTFHIHSVTQALPSFRICEIYFSCIPFCHTCREDQYADVNNVLMSNILITPSASLIPFEIRMIRTTNLLGLTSS